MNTARVIQLRPTQTPSLDPEEANRAYQGACAAFLRGCLDRVPSLEIQCRAAEMGRAAVNRYYAKKGRGRA